MASASPDFTSTPPLKPAHARVDPARRRVLFLTDPADADYGPDYMLHGFCALLGGEHVYEYPRKPSLHGVDIDGDRVRGGFDCDMDLSARAASTDDVLDGLAARTFDLIVVPTLRGSVPHFLYHWRAAFRKHADLIVFMDWEDHDQNMAPLFEQILGFPPVFHWKRELPLEADWANACPFPYPEERIVPWHEGKAGAAYAAHVWDTPTGPHRAQIGHVLLARSPRTKVFLSYNGHRLSRPDYHAMHQHALVAVSPVGGGYHTNRHQDVVANGCVPVYPWPTRQWAYAFHDGTHCRYYRSVDQIPDLVNDLLDNPATCQRMATAAQEWLRAYHTTRARAQQVWGAVHDHL